MNIVIVGNGVAGIEAALCVRAAEPDWPIHIVSEESDHFFSRTALMYVMCGQMRHRDIEPYERDLYAAKRFTRIRAHAAAVEPERKRLHLGGGLEPLDYDRLLIACGSKPRPSLWPGGQLKGVGHFVTLQDLEWLEAEVHGRPAADRPPRADQHLFACPPDSPYARRPVVAKERGRRPMRASVIGGGLIGAEVVETLIRAGVETDFIIREEWFWPMAIDARESAFIAERFEAHGAHVHLEHEMESFVGDGAGRLIEVKTARGPLPSDLAVVAIGVMPNTDWLSTSPIERDKGGGILVGDDLSTSVRDVFAAGDCASVRWFDGQKRPEQLWYTARDQGRVAGLGLLGRPAAYARGVFYNSAKLIDVEYTTAGLVNMKLEGEKNWFFEERGRVRSTTRIVLQGDHVVGFNLLGRRWDHSILVRWIEEKRDLAFVLAHLREASFDTELVPPLVVPKGIEAC